MPVIRSLGSALVVVMAACKGGGQAPSTNAGSGSSVVAVAADAAVVDAGPACVPGGKLLATTDADQQLRICNDKACVVADPASGALATVAYAKIEPALLASARVEERDKSMFACFKDACREIGKKARAVIARDPDVHNEQLAATTDLATLVIPKVSPQLWDIRADKQLTLKPPSGEKQLGEMRPVGTHIYAVWLPPAEAMYTRSGKLVSALFSDGTQLAMLDDARSVALTPDHRVFIFGDPEHKIELEPSVGNYDDWVKEPGALAVLADGTVAVIIERAKEAQLVLIDPQRGTVFRRWPLPRCPG